MVDPVTTSLAVGAAAGGILNFFERGKQRKIAQAQAEIRLEMLKNQAQYLRLKTRKEQRATEGEFTVAAGALGIQTGGSLQQASIDAVHNQEFEMLTKIAELKYQQDLQSLGLLSTESQLAASQASGLIGAGVSAGDVLGQGKLKEDLEKLQAQNVSAIKTTGAKLK